MFLALFFSLLRRRITIATITRPMAKIVAQLETHAEANEAARKTAEEAAQNAKIKAMEAAVEADCARVLADKYRTMIVA